MAGGSFPNAWPLIDAGDAVMARCLQSAELQHLASPSRGIDQRLIYYAIDWIPQPQETVTKGQKSVADERDKERDSKKEASLLAAMTTNNNLQQKTIYIN
ncbi:hypothetical protein AgCh_007906 [Apium graveolens]